LLQGALDDLINSHVHLHPLRGRPKRPAVGLPRQHLIEHHPQRIQISSMIDLAEQLLRCQYSAVPMTTLLLVSAMSSVSRAGQAEIGELYASVCGDEDVRGLDVAVDHTLAMEQLQRVANLADDLQNHGRFYAHAVDGLVQVGAIDELHDEIQTPCVRLPKIIHRNDAWMLQLGQGAGLGVETGGQTADPQPSPREAA